LIRRTRHAATPPPDHRRTVVARAGLAAATVALLSAACGTGAATGAGEMAAARREAPEVRAGTFVRRVLLTGELKAVRAHELTVPRTPQWQVAIRWMEADGATVAAGQKVLELDNSAVASNLEERRLAAKRAADALERAQAQATVTLDERAFAREQRRVARDKAAIDADVPEALLSGRDWHERRLALRRAEVELAKAEDELASARRGAEADVAVARIELDKARREVETAEHAIASLSVSAPTPGVLQVADHPWEGRKLQVGDMAWVGMTVLRIPDLAEMQVDAVLFDVDDGTIAPGARAMCTADTYPDEEFPGTVIAITPMAQELRRGTQRRAFRATVALERTDPARLRPGMSVKVEVEAERREGALLVPRSCIAPAGAAAVVLADGTRADVRLGPCSARECVVESGVAAGARLRRAAGGAS
jgi:multidrug resistance efflux pump